ncbi:methyltransferase domain protein [mine drainage metagenome]|uniref:Methyltransferase domain protein n=1 Tax=mine drainage metagenome TaxID=410659 RepID=A0A1J5SML3_9ZZZZ
MRSLAKIHFSPAVLAVLVQVVSLFLLIVFTFIFALVATFFFGIDLKYPLFFLVFLQALISTVLSRLIGMASWWGWIHFFFPIAACVMFAWNIPKEIYLVGFLVTLSLFWTTFRTQVPFFPSRPSVWQQVAKLVPLRQDAPIRIIDIGSGLGDMSMYLAKQRPDCRVEGIEIAPLPWLVSFIRAHIYRSAAAFSLGDYRQLNFANYDVIFAYLSPAAMLDLWSKAQAEMSGGSILISYEFDIPNVIPQRQISIGTQAPKLYVWEIGNQ